MYNRKACCMQKKIKMTPVIYSSSRLPELKKY